MSHLSWSTEPVDGTTIRLSEVVSALSAALDITEGQPEGHARRSCVIGMRLAQQVGLGERERSDLFYALLLKDLGCSSNAAKVCNLFGADDRKAKRELKLVDWSRFSRSVGYVARNVIPHGSLLAKVGRFLKLAKAGTDAARQSVLTRCERGAHIARQLMLGAGTALAIRSLDEHWDGNGYPAGLAGDRIPLASRIMNLAQTVDVFVAAHGVDAAIDVAMDRSGTWFDPELVRALRATRKDEAFWSLLATTGPEAAAGVSKAVASLEPADRAMPADADALDRLATAFALVVDAKSSWTYMHSEGVAQIAEGVAGELGFMPLQAKYVRRAALLHDLGKLGVSNLILDKPGKLDAHELAEMRKHPAATQRILEKVRGFSDLAAVAAGHHERLDGTGYHRGVGGDRIPLPARILAVADTYEALSAKRPYRQDLTDGEVMAIMAKNVGTGIDPEVFAALKAWLAKSKFEPVKLAA